MPFYPEEIKYSDKYYALDYEYTSVILPKRYLPQVSGRKLLSFDQIKLLGIEISISTFLILLSVLTYQVL